MFDVRQIKCVIFDCDGVMFDTGDVNRAYYNTILKHLGKNELTQEQFEFIQMSTLEEALDFLFPQKDELQKVLEFRKNNDQIYISCIPKMKIEPSLVELLNFLRPKYKTCVATNRSDTMSKVIEDHNLSNLFDMVVTALDVKKAKPYPDQLIKIMETFSLKSRQALFIGDSKTDEMAASFCNMPFIAYNNTKLKAEKHISNLIKIKAILSE